VDDAPIVGRQILRPEHTVPRHGEDGERLLQAVVGGRAGSHDEAESQQIEGLARRTQRDGGRRPERDDLRLRAQLPQHSEELVPAREPETLLAVNPPPERRQGCLGWVRHRDHRGAAPGGRVQLGEERLDRLDPVGHVGREDERRRLDDGLLPARGDHPDVVYLVLRQLLLEDSPHRRGRLDGHQGSAPAREGDGDAPSARTHVDDVVVTPDERGERVGGRVHALIAERTEVLGQRLPEIRGDIRGRADALRLLHLLADHAVVAG